MIRIIATVVGVLLALAMVAIIALYIVIFETEWGQGKVRDALAARLSEMVDGHVEIGHVDLTPSGMLTIDGLSVVNAEGRRVITARRAKLDFEWLPLLDENLVVDGLALSGLVVDARFDDSGTLDLATLFASGGGDGGDGSGWTTRIDWVSVDDAEVRVILPDGRVETVTELTAGAYLEHGEETTAVVNTMAGRLRERDLAFHASGAARLSGGILAARDVSIAIDGVALTARGACELSEPYCTVAAQVSIDRDGVDVDATVEAAGSGFVPGRLRAIGDVSVTGRVGPIHDVELDGSVVALGDVIDATSIAVSPYGSVSSATVVAYDGPRSSVLRSWARGSSKDVDGLARALGVELGVSARRVGFTGAAHGPLTDLSVRVDADIDGADYGSVRVNRARSAVAVDGVSVFRSPLPLSGDVDLVAYDVVSAARDLGRVAARGTFADNGRRLSVYARTDGLGVVDDARGNVDVRVSADRTHVAFGSVRVTTSDLTWRGRGGSATLTASGRTTIRGVALESPAGRVEISGIVEPAGSRRVDSRLRVNVPAVDLERARVALADYASLAIPLRGSGTGELELARRGAGFVASGTAEVASLGWRDDLEDVDAEATFEVGDGRLVATASAHTVRGELVVASVDVAAPRDAFDSRAWSALDADDVTAARFALDGVAIETLGTFGRRSLVMPGYVTGTIELDELYRVPRFDLEVEQVEVGGFDELAARVEGTWRGRTIAGSIRAEHRGETVTVGTYAVEPGAFELGWVHTPPDLASMRLAVDATVEDLALSRLSRVGLLPDAVRGRLSAEVVVRGTVSEPRGEVVDGRIERMRVAGVRFYDAVVSGYTDGPHIVADLTASQGGGGAAHIRASYSLEPGHSLAAILVASAIDVAVLRTFASSEVSPLAHLGGRLDANLRVGGSADAPTLTGDASIRGGTMILEEGARTVEDIDVTMRATGGAIEVSALSARSGRGTLYATGSVTLDRLVPDVLSFGVTTSEFPVALDGDIAHASLSGMVSGRYRDGGIVARVDVVDGSIRVDDGRSLQSIASLEDVVYIDERGVADRWQQGGSIGFPVRVRAVVAEGIRVRGPDVDAVVRADLTADFVDGDLTWLVGTADVVRGSVMIFERRYTINHGHARFVGPVAPNPVVELELLREFPAAEVTVHIDGRYDDPSVNIASDRAGYNDTQVLVIMLGDDPNEAGLGGSVEDSVGIANAVTGELRARIGIPVDMLRIREDGIELGTWVTKNLLIGYRYRSGADERENDNEGTLEWYFRKRWILEGRYGDKDVGNVDVLFIHRF